MPTTMLALEFVVIVGWGKTQSCHHTCLQGRMRDVLELVYRPALSLNHQCQQVMQLMFVIKHPLHATLLKIRPLNIVATDYLFGGTMHLGD